MEFRSIVFLVTGTAAVAVPLTHQNFALETKREAVIAEALSLVEWGAVHEQLRNWKPANLAWVLSRSQRLTAPEEIRRLADIQERIVREATEDRERLASGLEHRRILVELAKVDIDAALRRWETRPEIPKPYRSLSEAQFERQLFAMAAERVPERLLALYQRSAEQVNPDLVIRAVFAAQRRGDIGLAQDLIDLAYRWFAAAPLDDDTARRHMGLVRQLSSLGVAERRPEGIDLLVDRLSEWESDIRYTVNTSSTEVELTPLEFYVLHLRLSEADTIRRVPTLEVQIVRLGGWEALQGRVEFRRHDTQRVYRQLSSGPAERASLRKRILAGPESLKAVVLETIDDPNKINHFMVAARMYAPNLLEEVEALLWEAIADVSDPDRRSALTHRLLIESRSPVTAEVMAYWIGEARKLEVDESRLGIRAPLESWRIALLRRWARDDLNAALGWVRDHSENDRIRFHSLVTLLQMWPDEDGHRRDRED